MTKDRGADVAPGDDVPSYGGFPRRFLWELLIAWIAMGFRKPDMGLGHINKSKTL